ncbi:hypothetical protein GcM1_205002 [Golovinomyces cichoracearum]|uniref:Uncharacterized protein n=1 Tax=Golovinomyces cichoracearum TaxID=62708 RepID=A0A420IWX7_9PEZI|nr:hypothetical protein GcM1_205002 [Golovinomyces cichoracearum]
MSLTRKETTSLRETAEASTKRKVRQRKYIPSRENLKLGKIIDMLAPKVTGDYEKGRGSRKRV